MQTKVMTFLLPLALIRTQLWCVHALVFVCVCVFVHSHCLVASACLDQLSVWYLYGSNFSQCILVMALCSPYTLMERLSGSLSPNKTHGVCVTLHSLSIIHRHYRCNLQESSPLFWQARSARVAQSNTGAPSDKNKTRSLRLACECVWSGTTLWFLTGSKLRRLWFWQQCFINPFLTVSAVSCLNMNGMIGTPHTSSSKQPLSAPRSPLFPALLPFSCFSPLP